MTGICRIPFDKLPYSYPFPNVLFARDILRKWTSHYGVPKELYPVILFAYLAKLCSKPLDRLNPFFALCAPNWVWMRPLNPFSPIALLEAWQWQGLMSSGWPDKIADKIVIKSYIIYPWPTWNVLLLDSVSFNYSHRWYCWHSHAKDWQVINVG